MPHVRPSDQPKESSTPELLVSVRSAAEAELALDLGVDWIDLKEPNSGALGPADPNTAAEVAKILKNHPRTSAALGELQEVKSTDAIALAEHFKVLKVGLSNCGSNEAWPRLFAHITQLLESGCGNPCSLVPVIYADWEKCDAVPATNVLDFLQTQLTNARFVLIDTFCKDGSTMQDYLNLKEELLPLILRCNRIGVGVVLAGSLRLEDIPGLRSTGAMALGFRGALCDKDRNSGLSRQKMREAVSLFNTCQTA